MEILRGCRAWRDDIMHVDQVLNHDRARGARGVRPVVHISYAPRHKVNQPKAMIMNIHP